MHFTTDLEIDKEVAHGLLLAGEVANKHFEDFLQGKLVENKKSSFGPFCKARLITGKKNKRKFSKPLSIVKEVYQAFDLLVNKKVKFTKSFKYAIESLPLVTAAQESTVYEPDKARLRN